MKKISILLVAFALILGLSANNTFAQKAKDEKKEKVKKEKVKKEKKSAENKAEAFTRKMTKKLALTPDQRVKVKAVILERELQKEKDIVAFNGKPEEMKQAKIARNNKADEQFKTILDAAQYEKLKNWKKEVREKHKKKKKLKETDESVDIDEEETL